MVEFKKINLIAIIAMTIVSFASLFGIGIAGISVIIGVVFFIIHKTNNKNHTAESGLSTKTIRVNLKKTSIWILILLPIIMNVVCIVGAKFVLPEYIDYLYGRTEGMLSFDKIVLLILQLAILAFGEEIAWRGFYQKQLDKALPIAPTIIITSLIFSIAHMSTGDTLVVVYDLVFIFINSIIYGVIYYKTSNIWISTFAHFIANVFALLVIPYLL